MHTTTTTVRDLAHTLMQVLDDERNALVAGEAVHLVPIAERKQGLLHQLGAAFAALPAAQRRAMTPLLQQARDRNDFNAHLLAPRLLAVRARTEALLQAAGTAVYGADGATRQLAASRTTARA